MKKKTKKMGIAFVSVVVAAGRQHKVSDRVAEKKTHLRILNEGK